MTKPDIGWPIGRKTIVLRGVIASEEWKMGKLIGWHNKAKTQPIIEYPDGTREVVISLRYTNWAGASAEVGDDD